MEKKGLRSYHCSLSGVKAYAFDALGTCVHARHNAIHRQRNPVKIRPEITDRRLSTLFPLPSRNTRMVRVLAPCMTFFAANIARVGHRINFQLTIYNFQ